MDVTSANIKLLFTQKFLNIDLKESMKIESSTLEKEETFIWLMIIIMMNMSISFVDLKVINISLKSHLHLPAIYKINQIALRTQPFTRKVSKHQPILYKWFITILLPQLNKEFVLLPLHLEIKFPPRF